MEVITKGGSKERQCKVDEQVLQLLDSPLPTPRRSCGSADAPSLRCRPDASPMRTHVPFSWESSPGVPKYSAYSVRTREMLPPKPPPGRWQPCHARDCYYVNTSEASSDDDASFSDALDRISSPERLAGPCTRLTSFDRVTSRRFEDVIGRTPSFVTDRFHPATNAIATSSAGKQSKQWRRRSTHQEVRASPRQITDAVKVHPAPRINVEAQADQMSPRACGLMVFFPRAVKPTVCVPAGSPAHSQTPRAAFHPPSPPRRSTTLRDVLEGDKKSKGDLPRLRGEKRSREEWQGRGWGMSFLGASKKYCTDARKALSRLSIGLGTDSSSPRVSGERRSGKQGVSAMPTAAKLQQLMPPS